MTLGKLAGLGNQDLVITRIRGCCAARYGPVAGPLACRGCSLSPLWFEEFREGGGGREMVRPAIEGWEEDGVLERRCIWLGRACIWERGWRARLKERLERMRPFHQVSVHQPVPKCQVRAFMFEASHQYGKGINAQSSGSGYLHDWNFINVSPPQVLRVSSMMDVSLLPTGAIIQPLISLF